MKTRSLILSLVAVFAVTLVAYAAVNYNPETGGTVGKGDVQTALGFNNAALQRAVQNNLIQFRYSDNIVVEGGRCLFTEGANEGNPHPTDTWRRTSGLSSTVQYDAKQRNQVVGFILGPIGSGQLTYTDECGGNRAEGPGSIISVLPGDGLEVSGDGGNTWVSLQ